MGLWKYTKKGVLEGGDMRMKKSEVKDALDSIRDMSAEDIAINWVYIKKVTEAAYSLIKSLERR